MQILRQGSWSLALVLVVAANAGAQTTTTFPGGDLDDLRALDPELIFDQLVITGDLELSPSDGEVVLQVQGLTISGTGRVSYSQSTCSYSNAPGFSVFANDSVEILGSISLNGKSGDPSFDGASCNQCTGRDGGDIRIEGQSVRVAALLSADGGFGSNFTISVGGTVLRTGCDGGDAGNIEVVASDTLDLDQARFEVDGGSGGFGTDGNNGDPGLDGSVAWVAPIVQVEEIEPNGGRSFAQRLPAVPLELRGFVDTSDGASDSNPIVITFGGNPPDDRLEDLFLVSLASVQTLKVSLTPDASVDLDLYLLNSAVTQVLGQSNGPTGNEQITVNNLAAGDYYVGVSDCCGGSTNYTLRIGDPVTPPPDPPDPPPGLVIVDLEGSGDGLVISDTATRLDWLNLTQAKGLSYNEVLAGAGGWIDRGWRHATPAEVCGLFARYASAPSPCPSPFGSALSADLTSALQYALGITGRDIIEFGSSSITAERTEGLFADDTPANSNVGFASMKVTFGTSEIAVQRDGRTADWSDPRVGHFLVRPRSFGLFRAAVESDPDEPRPPGSWLAGRRHRAPREGLAKGPRWSAVRSVAATSP